ncbi:MAG: YkgJ family cysteine cluster protein [Desulfobacteraceae bacterium]|nr:YkgJ family cysteine cluster protein [Desulfobacteraceae bacterium]
MLQDLNPEYVRPLVADDEFRFRCHPGVSCFNECCRELELALTPYDVLRLKGALGLSARELLERYAVIERNGEEPFPRVYLGMVDDGRGSCPFVSPAGCTVYRDRPGACRMYPLARGIYQDQAGGQGELFMLVTEPHCQGFAAAASQDIDGWIGDQELITYNAANDQVAAVLHHERAGGLPPDAAEKLLLLYDLDGFREMVLAPGFAAPPEIGRPDPEKCAANDLALFRYAIRWLRFELFGASNE